MYVWLVCPDRDWVDFSFFICFLHQVAVDAKSSLARERLVDFTGELQIRRESIELDDEGNPIETRLEPIDNRSFTPEPTTSGGRVESDKPSVFSKELAPVPLQVSPPSTLSSGGTPVRGKRLHGYDIEPSYHSTFCNELLFTPRMMHNCPKRVVAIMVEVREIEWKESFYVAHECPSMLHNPRRGPFLVSHAFTTCSITRNAAGSAKGYEHHFVDEFKVKLPLDLKPRRKDGSSRTLALFFTVYSVKISSRGKWKRTKGLFSALASSSDVGDSAQPHSSAGKSKLDQLACGFLPLSTPTRLVENGIHDVRLAYKSKPPPKEMRESMPDSSLILHEQQFSLRSRTTQTVNGEVLALNSAREDSGGDETTNSEDESASERHAFSDLGLRSQTSDLGDSVADESISKGGRQLDIEEAASLSVGCLVVVDG